MGYASLNSELKYTCVETLSLPTPPPELSTYTAHLAVNCLDFLSESMTLTITKVVPRLTGPLWGGLAAQLMDLKMRVYCTSISTIPQTEANNIPAVLWPLYCGLLADSKMLKGTQRKRSSWFARAGTGTKASTFSWGIRFHHTTIQCLTFIFFAFPAWWRKDSLRAMHPDQCLRKHLIPLETLGIFAAGWHFSSHDESWRYASSLLPLTVEVTMWICIARHTC